MRVVLLCTVGLAAWAWAPAWAERAAGSSAPEETATPGVAESQPADSGQSGLLDLERAQRMALENNPTIHAAETRIRQAQERVNQALAAYWPQLGARASGSKTWLAENDYRRAKREALLGTLASGSGFSVFGGGTLDATAILRTAGTGLQALKARSDVDQTSEFYTVSLEASWLLFNGFERRYRVLAAEHNAQEFEAVFRDVQRLLLDAVAAAYYNALFARENIAIAEADMAFNERQLREAEARRRVGTGSLSDELNFRVRVNQARINVSDAQAAYDVALIGLGRLMGLDDVPLREDMALAPLADAAAADLERPDAKPLIDYALAQRPDIEQSTHAVRRAAAQVGAAKGSYYPSVALNASKDMQSGVDFQLGEDDFSTTVGLSVSYDLFTGGRRKAVTQEARAALSEAEWLRRDTELAVAQDVRQSIEQLQNAQEVLEIEAENAEHVSRNRDLVEKEYRAGVGSLVRLNEAQRDLIAAQVNLARARVALRQAWHTLRTATGEILAARGLLAE